jgi:hypothetical protein
MGGDGLGLFNRTPVFEMGVIASFPDAYAANRLFCRMLDDSDESLGIGLDAKYF